MHRAVAPLLLGCLSLLTGRPCAAFEVSVDPPVLVVPYNGSVSITLNSSCTKPIVTLAVETSIRYDVDNRSSPVMEVVLQHVTDGDPEVLFNYCCFEDCKRVEVELVIYRELEQPELEPIPQLKAGDTYNLTCRVPNVSPVRNLTVTLRLGDSVLHEATFKGHPLGQPENVAVTHRLTARRDHRARNVTCHAALDLRPHGPRFTATAAERLLDVYDFPGLPTLTTAGAHLESSGDVHLETGAELRVNCSARDAFPAAQFAWFLDRQPLEPLAGNGRSAAVTLAWEQPGKHQLLCSVRVGPEERATSATIHVYDFPVPQLNVSTLVPVATSNVTGSCVLPGGRSEGIELRVTLGQRVLVPWQRAPLLFTLTVTEDDGSELRCEAKLPGERGATKRSDVVRLNVTTLPHMDDASCPPTQTWTEGQEATLQCRARGNPVPVVTCHKDGTVVPVGRSHVVTRNYTGTYWCNATNALGTSRRNVTVTVEYRDINVGLVVALVTLAAVAAVTGVVVYRVYYHKKKIRHYKLQEKQQRLLAMGQLTDGATVAQNGSAPAAQP